MHRESIIAELSRVPIWDIVIIGGGATGLGCAVDAASRGYKTLLLEQADFSQGTSSRSTKLIHGGVRYLKQGDIPLVVDALRERGRLLKNAPHLVRKQSFIIPIYKWTEAPLYLLGLQFYDFLAGRSGLGSSRWLAREETIKALPALRREGLRGGVVYYDGIFDDSRLAVNLAQTCYDHGGCPVNYMRVGALMKSKGGKIEGVVATDVETGRVYEIKAQAVINCTGVFSDQIMQMDNPAARNMIKPSQGVHLVLGKKFLSGVSALMVPRTEDGRVLFAIPWQNVILVGTTDTELDTVSLEPRALNEEIEFILRNAAGFLHYAPAKKDVLCVFAGLRPLAAPEGRSPKTKEISRSHKIIVSDTGLVTVLGGKWTTYRKIAEDTIDRAVASADLQRKTCRTRNLKIHGWQEPGSYESHTHVYGSDISGINKLIQDNASLSELFHNEMPFTKAEVVWSIRQEMARTVEDILARRQRALFLFTQASREIVPEIARIIAKELGRDESWISSQVGKYRELLKGYTLEGG